MRWRTAVACALSLLLGLACHSQADEATQGPCTPSLLDVPDQGTIEAEVGTWRVLFKLALVGCADELQQITNRELATLEHELREPSAWSNLLLVSESGDPGFRQKVVERFEEILGRRVVTDVLFHDVTLLDHNVQ